MKEQDDGRLIEEALAGHPRAMEGIVDRYYKIVFSVAMKMINNPDDAADITQNVFIKIHRNLHRYNPQYKFFSWIYRIAMNETINHINTRDHRTDALDESLRAEGTPETVLAQSETEAAVQRALMELTPEHRSVIVLSHFQGLSYREVAETLEIPEKTVKSRLFSARQALKAVLMQHGVRDT